MPYPAFVRGFVLPLPLPDFNLILTHRLAMVIGSEATNGRCRVPIRSANGVHVRPRSMLA